MSKGAQQIATKSDRGSVGCMGGLVSLFDFRRGSQKLLPDKSHRRSTPVADNKQSRNGRKKNNNKKDRGLNRDSANGANAAPTSVKMLMEKDMSTVHKHQTSSAKIVIKQQSSDRSAHNRNQNSGVDKKNHGQASANSAGTSDNSSDLAVSTGSDVNQVQFRSLIELLSSNLDVGALMQEYNNHKYESQTTGADSTKLDLFQNNFFLQNALGEVWEVFCKYSDGESHPENFVKTLEILSSNKDMFLKVLQDPNSILLKHAANFEECHAGKATKVDSGEPEVAISHVTSSNENVSNKASRKHGLKNIFRKKDKSKSEKSIEVNESGQPPGKIVVLKPAPVRMRSPSEVVSPSTSPQSPYQLRANMDNGRVAFGFSFKQMKRRLKNAIGEHGKDQHPIPTNGLSKLNVTSNYSQGHDEVRQSNETNIRGKATKAAGHQADCNKEVTEDHNSSNRTCRSCKERVFQKKAKKHLVEMLDSSASAENKFAREISKPLGKILSQSENAHPPKFTPEKHKELGVLPLKFAFSPPWDPKESINRDQCNNADAEGETLESNLKPLGAVVDKNSSTTEGVSPRYFPGRHKELGLLPRQLRFSPPLDSNQKNDSSRISSSADVLESSSCTPSNSHSEQQTLCLNQEHLSSPIKKDCLTTEALIPEDSDEVLDAEHVKARGSFDIIEQDDDDEACLVEESMSLQLDSTEQKSTSTPAASPSNLNVNNKEAFESIIEKPERPSPISILEAPFFDDICSPGIVIENDEVTIVPRELPFEEYDEFDVVLTTFTRTNLRSCMNDEKFKAEYVISLLHAADLTNYETWEKLQFTDQVLDPLLYDLIETPSGEIPDDLKLLFDCINEVLVDIHRKHFSCTPYCKFGLRFFLDGEGLKREVLTRISYQLTPNTSQTLQQIIEKDLDSLTWMDIRIEKEDTANDVSDQILKEMLVETALELCECE